MGEIFLLPSDYVKLFFSSRSRSHFLCKIVFTYATGYPREWRISRIIFVGCAIIRRRPYFARCIYKAERSSYEETSIIRGGPNLNYEWRCARLFRIAVDNIILNREPRVFVDGAECEGLADGKTRDYSLINLNFVTRRAQNQACEELAFVVKTFALAPRGGKWLSFPSYVARG